MGSSMEAMRREVTLGVLYTFQSERKSDPMRRTKEEAARTREAIVEAALGCFDRRGIAHTTLDEIAAAAGVTQGAVYHHFSGKAEILRTIRDCVTVSIA